MTIQQRIKALRKSRKWKQRDLGKKSGLSRVTIGLIERGATNTSLDHLQDIADALECDLILDLKERGCEPTSK